jgi:hypothetical protein
MTDLQLYGFLGAVGFLVLWVNHLHKKIWALEKRLEKS